MTTEPKIRSFNVKIINEKDGVKKTVYLNDCKFGNLKELVLKIADKCHENEDDDFVSFTVKQLKPKSN